jgi:outer membrane receptor protein involved in Fe transport
MKKVASMSAPASAKRSYMKAAWLAVPAACVSISSFGASNDERSGNLIEEVIVTAQMRAEPLLKVPMTVVAMGSEELEQRAITNIRELSYAVPELAVFDDGVGGNQLFLRGIGGVGGSEPLVGVYLDDIGVSGQSYYPLDIRSLDLQRVEVLYGPQGTLYGQGSAGGTVRFITNKPSFASTFLDSTMDLSFTTDGSSNERVIAVANVPVVNDVFAFRIASSYEDNSGWVDAPAANKRDINGNELYNVRLTGLWKVTEAITLTPMVMIYRNDVDSSGNGENDQGDKITPPFSPTTVLGTKTDQDLYALTATFALGWAELLSVSSYYRNDNDGGFTNAFGTFHRIFNKRFRSTVFDQEVRLTSAGDDAFSWTLGAFYSDVDYDDFTTLTSAFGGFSFPTIERGTSWSFFANTAYDVTDRLELGAGARYFSQEKTNGEQNPSFNSFDPRVYASYALTENVRTFVSAAKGFRGGGFNSIDPTFPPQFDPEEVYSYEAGLKFASAQSRTRGELSVFHSDYEDMQVDFLDPDTGLGYTDNVGKAKIDGADGSVHVEFASGTTLGASATWLKTRVEEAPVNFSLTEGDRLNYIPKYSYGVSAQQELMWSASMPGLIRVDYNERGSSMFTSRTAGLIDESDVVNMLNARVEATWRNLRFSVYGENLLNDRDRIVPNIVQFAPRTRPRTIGFQFNARFD